MFYISFILFKYLCYIRVKFQVLKGLLLSEKLVRNSYLVGEHCIREHVISLYINLLPTNSIESKKEPPRPPRLSGLFPNKSAMNILDKIGS